MPRKTASRITQSSTVRAIGPAVSSDGHTGYKPSSDKRPIELRNPTSPLNAQGTLIEPPVSLPTAMGTEPSATATADPDEDPPGTRATSRLCGFAGVPK